MKKAITAKRWATAIQEAAKRIGYPPRGPRCSANNYSRMTMAGALVREAKLLIQWRQV